MYCSYFTLCRTYGRELINNANALTTYVDNDDVVNTIQCAPLDQDLSRYSKSVSCYSFIVTVLVYFLKSLFITNHCRFHKIQAISKLRHIFQPSKWFVIKDLLLVFSLVSNVILLLWRFKG